MARHTDYSEAALSKARDYLKNPTSYGDVVPTVAGLSIVLDVARSTVYLWAKEHKEFSDSLEDLMSVQEKELITNGLQSLFNPVIAKLMLGRHGYSDKQEVTGKDGAPLFDEETRQKANGAIASILPTGNAEQGNA